MGMANSDPAKLMEDYSRNCELQNVTCVILTLSLMHMLICTAPLALDFQRVTLSTYLRLSADLSLLVVILLVLPVTRYVREMAHLHRDYL
jgi:hypothetical protein